VKPVRLRRIAKRHLLTRVKWYRERDPELANRFLNEVYKTLALLERLPNAGGVVFGITDPNIRQLPVDNFPYHIVFKKTPLRTIVLGIVHDRMKPGSWNE
jgi:plasmid stabilization system protein ParE